MVYGCPKTDCARGIDTLFHPGSIPRELGALSDLTELFLYTNQLSGDMSRIKKGSDVLFMMSMGAAHLVHCAHHNLFGFLT